MPTNSNQKNTSITRDKLVEDVSKVLTKDVQDLLKETASVVGEKAAVARGKVEESLRVAQDGKLANAARNRKAAGASNAVTAN